VFGYGYLESVIIGIAAMFSSTIIGIKLLPTSTLHHQHTGELLISVLLLQDILAIIALLILEMINGSHGLRQMGFVVCAFPVLFIVAYLFQRYLLTPLLTRFDKIQEYIFILSIGWCLGMAELGHAFGLSEEIGAFIAGVALASNPVAFYIAESLKPLRDFFLVIFFFTVGAEFNFHYFPNIVGQACIFAALILILKPVVFWLLFNRAGEVSTVSFEIGVRLGQLSEFSLLLNYLALQSGLLSPTASAMLSAAVIMTFIASCYWTVFRYPTPLAVTERLRRD